jgi:DtxR family Mn-dependent transcriptional regulator
MTQSLEDYLEAIYILINQKKVARVKEVSEMLSVKKPSVITALKELKARNFIQHEKYGYIELTEEGRKEAGRILDKHQLLKKFLIEVIGVNESQAETEACSIEHYLSTETAEKIRKFTESYLAKS